MNGINFLDHLEARREVRMATGIPGGPNGGQRANLAVLIGFWSRPVDLIIIKQKSVTQTVQRYTNEATDEEWVTLMGMLNRSPDPGTTCLKRVFEHALRG
jgi:hypothetical protein